MEQRRRKRTTEREVEELRIDEEEATEEETRAEEEGANGEQEQVEPAEEETNQESPEPSSRKRSRAQEEEPRRDEAEEPETEPGLLADLEYYQPEDQQQNYPVEYHQIYQPEVEYQPEPAVPAEPAEPAEPAQPANQPPRRMIPTVAAVSLMIQKNRQTMAELEDNARSAMSGRKQAEKKLRETQLEFEAKLRDEFNYKLQIQFAKANQKLEADKRTRADQISAALEQRTKEVEEHRKQLVQFQQAYETQNAEREETDKETILKSKKYQK